MFHAQPLTPWVTLLAVKRREVWKCNVLAVDCGAEIVLIDGNLTAAEIDRVEADYGRPVSTVFSTHTHLDHVNHLHAAAARGIRILSPAPEAAYLRDIDRLLVAGGMRTKSEREEMKHFMGEVLGLKPVPAVEEFTPGAQFAIGGITIRSVHLPGHAPGHCGYLAGAVSDVRQVFLVADLGLDDFGAWYGFDYCDLAAYRESIHRAETLYDPENHVLLGSHGRPHFPENPGNFKAIRAGIDRTGELILAALRECGAATVDELACSGLYYSPDALGRLDGTMKKLYRYWERCTILHHLRELEERRLVRRDAAADRWSVRG